MAKYTELLSEYLEGGRQLPTAFGDIEGFEDLFKLYYCDKEIGFETEDLFEIKLICYAEIYIPIYADRISDLATAITGARNPTRTFYEKYNTTIDAGAQKGKTTDLPFDSATATPNSITESDAYQNKDERITNREEKGTTVTEAYFIIDELNKKVKPLILELLKEFESCFMKVY